MKSNFQRSLIAEVLTDEKFPFDLIDGRKVHKCLDLCTGSGFLAILAYHLFPASKIYAADISSDALEVAKLNVANYGLEERITCIKSDMFQSLSKEKFDLIVCNPPYVTSQSMDNLPAEFKV
jgi:ribosomal protein L3 glutamine methyltransferase